ncbi:cytochrome P450 monooxygenase [Hysterangium stoloniferum]|nr:cytochrome P450 monooxygenase [Hysterangium stoloniferum]
MAISTYIIEYPLHSLLVLVLSVPAYHLFLWLRDDHGIRDIPGPGLAALSDAWLAYWAAQGCRSEHVHEVHKKYGKFLRIAPNHVSISEPDALQIVYGHGNGTMKSDFYDAFVSIRRGLFNTRSRPEHTRKRKIVAHIFSQKNVMAFETNAQAALKKLITQWDKLCEGGLQGRSGEDGEGGWVGRKGRVWFDVLPWYNYLAFDIIGDLAFGAPFGMLDAAQDIAPVAISKPNEPLKTVYIPAVQILNSRGDFSASMGVIPPWLRPTIKRFPWYAKGQQAVKHLAGIAIAAVEKRLADPSAAERGDLLAKLQEGKDENGNPMGKEELIAEALTQLIAGSDTTSNSSCGITYYLARHPEKQRKLQAELDAALGFEEGVIPYESVKRLTYLDACINESLRLQSTSSMGLPRVVPDGGLEVCGRFFKEGTVLSVPSYTIHRDPDIWGQDVDDYRPERWFERNEADILKTFNPFSYGPRGCVGKNLATMELLIIIATVFRRYEFVLEDPNTPFLCREGFLRKPLYTRVGMKRRVI